MFNIINKSKNSFSLTKALFKDGLISKKELSLLKKKSENEGKFLSEIIFKHSSHPREKILEALSDYYNVPVVDLKKKKISPYVLNMIPREISQQHNVVIFKKIADLIYIATVSPENKQIVEFIEKKTGFKTEVFLTSLDDINHALSADNRRGNNDDLLRIIDLNLDTANAGDASAEKMAEMVPVIKLVNSLIDRGVRGGASDIHIQPGENNIIVRYRVDGILIKATELPKNILQALVARIKIMADLKIDEHIIPQDGRFQLLINDEKIAFRVSIIPTLHGPKIALRVLEMKENLLTLRKLGLNKIHFKLIKNEIKSSHGIILVTGPTGAGKTTTLYTILQMLNKEGVNICTIEDPIEYGIENINQMQIRPSVGVTFASGLKSLLRQDPNILMVGEIRDGETASIAINSAMTGHLVLSTIHTNNAFLAPQRLIEMGMQQYLTGTVLNLIMGQRLVRKLCAHCRTLSRKPENIINSYQSFVDIKSSLERLQKSGLLLPGKNYLNEVKIYKNKGCKKCSNTGYQGRTGIYEIIKVDENVRRAIINNGSEQAVKEVVLKNNTIKMNDDGVLKVLNGVTTFDEIIRVTKE